MIGVTKSGCVMPTRWSVWSRYAAPPILVKGEISVTLRSITEDEIELRVSDDGIGIPEDLDFRNTDTLGLELITILAEDQLEGKIDLDRTGGTSFRILFKEQI
jgi:two-component sensor histidine kinase